MAVRAADRSLVEVGAVLMSACDRLDAVVDAAARIGAEVIGDCCVVWVAADGEGSGGRVSCHHVDPATDRIVTATPGGAVDAPPHPGPAEPTVLPASAREQLEAFLPEHLRPVHDRLDVSAALVCPLADHGLLVLVRTGAGGGYRADDVDTAGGLARQVAAAVATARSTERLRASEERYRGIVETTLDGVWQLDGDGVTTFANDRMAEMLRLPRAELIGSPMSTFLDRDGRAELPRRLADLRDGRSDVYECRLVRTDGTALWVQISAAPLNRDGGTPAGGLCTVTDITERVAAREMRRQLDQLRRADSLGQLAGGIAHDFNNLLTVIAGSAELLASEFKDDPDRYRLATQIVQSAGRGSALTHQLLSFGRRSPHAQRVSVPDLLAGARDLLGRALGEHIRLDVVVESGVWPVRADRGQLEQVLANLAVNARDAMGRGGVLTIEAANTVIEAGQLDDPNAAGRFVRLAVSDTGTGMDRETQLRAFEPFFTTKQARGSAGLGLTTVEGVVRASGGHIRLYSEPGIGTTVKMFLPAHPDTAAEAAPRAAPAAPAARAGSLRRARILVVEDQPELAQLTLYLLEPAGYTVSVATDPATAIAYVHTGGLPDLLLTDVVMPGMTGPELARALRARRPGLRVLYMSGYTAGVLNPQGHLDDDSALLQKPFNRETLLAAVERALA